MNVSYMRLLSKCVCEFENLNGNAVRCFNAVPVTNSIQDDELLFMGPIPPEHSSQNNGDRRVKAGGGGRKKDSCTFH